MKSVLTEKECERGSNCNVQPNNFPSLLTLALAEEALTVFHLDLLLLLLRSDSLLCCVGGFSKVSVEEVEVGMDESLQ